jgi:hypothetical protein
MPYRSAKQTGSAAEAERRAFARTMAADKTQKTARERQNAAAIREVERSMNQD